MRSARRSTTCPRVFANGVRIQTPRLRSPRVTWGRAPAADRGSRIPGLGAGSAADRTIGEPHRHAATEDNPYAPHRLIVTADPGDGPLPGFRIRARQAAR